MSEQDYMVTTKDNPHNYFTEFKEWYQWDTSEGYHTLSLLARLTRTSDELPQQDEESDINDAIDVILTENWNGMYVKVFKPEATKEVKG